MWFVSEFFKYEQNNTTASMKQREPMLLGQKELTPT
jgi:hypothetical protein